MRHPFSAHPFAAIPLLVALLLGSAAQISAAQTNAQVNPSAPAQQNPPNAAPPPSQDSTTNRPDQQPGKENAIRSKSGQAGTQEPSSAVPTNEDAAVFVNGALNVPGGSKDSQTVPAKFSARNAALDKLPIMAQMLRLSDEQRQKILASVLGTNAPVTKVGAMVSQELPSTVELYELPPALDSQVPGMKGLKFVKLADKILLVYAPNWIVVGVIEGSTAK